MTATHPPLPAGATRVDEWGKSWRGRMCRTFDGNLRFVDRCNDWGTIFVPIIVAIAGIQYADGRARRAIHLKQPDGPLTPGQARELAAAHSRR
jgi:hypothetical protein